METEARIRYLEERLENLAQEKREAMAALETAANLGAFEISLNKLDNVDVIFS